jgi:hypothetical protein
LEEFERSPGPWSRLTPRSSSNNLAEAHNSDEGAEIEEDGHSTENDRSSDSEEEDDDDNHYPRGRPAGSRRRSSRREL